MRTYKLIYERLDEVLKKLEAKKLKIKKLKKEIQEKDDLIAQLLDQHDNLDQINYNDEDY